MQMLGKDSVLVIGLDGATFDLLNPLMDAGVMPTLQHLMKIASGGVLYSTIPPTTGPAWATFQTGTNPGKHGIVDFMCRRPGTYEPMLVDATMIRVPTVWSILSRHGRRICVMNVPLTYPVQPVNGYLIAGFLTPSTEVPFTYPPDLQEQLLAQFPDYVITPSVDILTLGPKRFVQTLSDIVRLRCKAAKWLIKQGPWDLFMVHFQETDLLQHALWSCLDPAHPRFARHSSEERSLAYGFYRAIDQAIGELIQSADSALTIIVSDHGFGPARKRIYLNRWLADHHYLGLKDGKAWMEIEAKLEDWLRDVDIFHLRRRWLPKDFKRGRGRLIRRLTQDPWIDWSQTRAFLFPGATYGNLYLNLIGREPHGIVAESTYEQTRAELIEALRGLEDPDVRGPVIERIYCREDIFNGPSLSVLPDLIVRPRGDYLLETRFKGKRIFEPLPLNITGSHRAEGICILVGAPFEPGHKLPQAKIVDMAPMLLHLLDIQPPEWMDGNVWEWIKHSTHTPHYTTPSTRSEPAVSQHHTSGYSDGEEAQVIEHLHRLGYL